MKLWVLRHGEAHNQAASDAARELTQHGREQVLHSAAHLLGQPLQAIFASPYVRAQQTAALVHEALGFSGPITTVNWLTPEQSPQAVADKVAALGLDNLLLVSHQPLVGTLLGLLDKGHASHEYPMGTASLAELEGEFPLAGLLTLKHLHHA